MSNTFLIKDCIRTATVRERPGTSVRREPLPDGRGTAQRSPFPCNRRRERQSLAERRSQSNAQVEDDVIFFGHLS